MQFYTHESPKVLQLILSTSPDSFTYSNSQHTNHDWYEFWVQELLNFVLIYCITFDVLSLRILRTLQIIRDILIWNHIYIPKCAYIVKTVYSFLSQVFVSIKHKNKSGFIAILKISPLQYHCCKKFVVSDLHNLWLLQFKFL